MASGRPGVGALSILGDFPVGEVPPKGNLCGTQLDTGLKPIMFSEAI